MGLRVTLLLLVLLLSVLFGWWRRRRDGRPRAVATGTHVTAAELKQELGSRATLLQVSSAFCGPCRTARRVLTQTAAAVPGVRHVEVDAAEHPGLVKRLDVLRTPTLLVLDRQGRVVHRASGVPVAEQVLAAVTTLTTEASRVRAT